VEPGARTAAMAQVVVVVAVGLRALSQAPQTFTCGKGGKTLPTTALSSSVGSGVILLMRYTLCICVAAMLAGCSGSQPPIGAPGAMPQTSAIATHADRGKSWVPNGSAETPGGKTKGRLFVDVATASIVEIFSNGGPTSSPQGLLQAPGWNKIGAITNGISYPNGNWVDKDGNLYVANVYSGSTAAITEYDRSGSLKFTYSSGMVYPSAVATDINGNVFEADWFTGVTEYRQGSNTVVANCPQLGGGQRGIAVDAQGDVFASYSTASGGAIEEYTGGLAGCPGTTLSVSLGAPGGMAIDKNANLVVCDETNATVDVIDPPYSEVSGHLGGRGPIFGYTIPVAVAINKENTRAYVTDYGGEVIDVFAYPTGSPFAKVDFKGYGPPTGAVDGSNYVARSTQ
jgi:hypothetical protein